MGEPRGQRLKRIRESKGLTQPQLAQRAGIPVGSLRNLEQGHRDNPTLSTLSAIAEALQVGLDELTGFQVSAK